MGRDTRKRIAREYRLVKRFAGKGGNEELDGGEGGVNGAAGKATRAGNDSSVPGLPRFRVDWRCRQGYLRTATIAAGSDEGN